MKISIITLFPQMFQGPFDYSIINRAKQKDLVEIAYINIRDFGLGQHKIVDDTPYGGGIGMVMRVDVLDQAISYAKKNSKGPTLCVLTSASGKKYTQTFAEKYSRLNHLIIVCGHYEGIDERVTELVDEEISIGDFVLTGGEIPAMLICDSVVRLIEGVLPDGAVGEESFSNESRILEYPHYTKPQEYNNKLVPKILLSGDHKKIKEWRIKKSLEKTQRIRPDLLKK